MKNRFGVDISYFTEKLGVLIRDIGDYTPEELSRSLARLAKTAHADTLAEPEFTPRQTAVSADGYSMVPASMELDYQAMQRLLAITGEADNEEEFSECVLWVGETVSDDGSRYHGLNVSISDYPEEGAIPVIEFPAPATGTG